MNTIYEYTDKYGVKFTGTLQEIGDDLILDQGDWRLQDNPEPWYDQDDYTNVADKPFTLEQWIEWAAVFEDLPIHHVEKKLTAI